MDCGVRSGQMRLQLAAPIIAAILIVGCGDDLSGPALGSTTSSTFTSSPAGVVDEPAPRFTPPPNGVLITQDGDVVSFHDVDGNEIATWQSRQISLMAEALPGVAIGHTDGTVYTLTPRGVEAIDDIVSHWPCQPGFTVCGELSAGYENLLTPEGVAVRTPYEIPEGERIPGFWRYVVAAESDELVLGQYSAECEIPSVAMIDRSGTIAWHLENATALGWTGDRAIIRIVDGACGDAGVEQGVYTADPDGELSPLRTGNLAAAFWSGRPAACAHARPDLSGAGAVVTGRFDRSGDELRASVEQGPEGSSWLRVEPGPTRRLDRIPVFDGMLLGDGPGLPVEWLADFTGDGIDELVIDPGIANDQHLYPIQLTSCSATLLSTAEGQPFFFTVASGPTYEVGYTCWGSAAEFEGVITIEGTGARAEDGDHEFDQITLTGWGYREGIMQPVDLTGTEPASFDCPGRQP